MSNYPDDMRFDFITTTLEQQYVIETKQQKIDDYNTLKQAFLNKVIDSLKEFRHHGFLVDTKESYEEIAQGLFDDFFEDNYLELEI